MMGASKASACSKAVVLLAAMVFAVAMALGAIPPSAYAQGDGGDLAIGGMRAQADAVASGTCGAAANEGGAESVTWSLDSDGVLTIGGAGKMADYKSSGTTAPWLGYREDIKGVVIGEGVTSIGNYAFNISKTVTYANLRSAEIPSTVNSIGKYAFANTGLMTVSIPRGAIIGQSAFSNCESLVSIDLGASTVGIGAFSGDSLLRQVTVRSQVATLNMNGFKDAGPLLVVRYEGSEESWTALKNTAGNNNSNLFSAENTYFNVDTANESAIESIAIQGDYTKEYGPGWEFDPTGIIVVGTAADGTSRVLNDQVTYSGFDSTVPGECTVTASCGAGEAAKAATFAVTVHGESDTRDMGACGADGADVTWTLTWGGVLTVSGQGNMGSAPWKGNYYADIVKAVIEPGVTQICSDAFYYDNTRVFTNLSSVEIGASVTTIGRQAFYKSGLTGDLKLPAGLRSIGDHAFTGCSIEGIELPETSLGTCNGAFRNTSLKRVVVPEGWASIPEGMFFDCVQLEEIVLPVSLESIDKYAFEGCASLASVQYNGTKPGYNYLKLSVNTTGNDALLGAQVTYAVQGEAESLACEGTCKTEYKAGEAIDLTGLTFTATLTAGGQRTVDASEIEVVGYKPGVLGDQTVHLMYSGAEALLGVTVVMPFEGQGTQDDPYQLAASADVDALDVLVEAGTSFEGGYFALAGDIVLADGWDGIGASGKPFSGELDGQGHMLTVPAGGDSVFARVAGATIRSLKVYGERIDSYGLVRMYTVDRSHAYYARFYNVTLVSGTKTLKSGFIGGYAGSADGVLIKDCTVEEGCVIGYDKAQSNIGSFAGEINGISEAVAAKYSLPDYGCIVNCQSDATVYGVNYVGGIVGDQGQSMASVLIQGNRFGGTVEATGKYVGGIMGGGYAGTGFGLGSAPNTGAPSIVGNVCSGSVTGANAVGGILGAENCQQQGWGNTPRTITDNCFTGALAATADGGYKGGIIGFMQSLNDSTQISGNYYAASCGADCGIGAIAHVDTSAVSGGYRDGTFYFNTAVDAPESINGTELRTYVELSQIQGIVEANHNRADDPLGDGAELLCHSDEQLADYSAVEAALAKVPEDFENAPYTDASIAALKAAIAAVDQYRPAFEQDIEATIDGWAQGILDAIDGLTVDEGKAIEAAEDAAADAKDAAAVAKQAADNAAALKAAADAETDIVKKVEATTKAALAAVDAQAKAEVAKQAADDAVAAAEFARDNATSPAAQDSAAELLKQAKEAQAKAADAVAAAATAAGQAKQAADAAKQAQDAAKAPKDNPMKVAAKSVKAKAKKLKKKAQTVRAVAVSGAEGKVTYKIVKVKAKKKLLKQAKKKIKMAADGKLKLKKKLKKGTYKVTVRVAASGNASFKPTTKDVVVKVKVK